jgi:hypothetical protein
MIITKKSQITGIEHKMDIPMTEKQFIEWFELANPRLVQDIFPELSAEQREFLVSGITPEEWDEHVGSEIDKERQADEQEE